MRINIFRNPFIDVQVNMLLDSLDSARRKETESYWTETILNRINSRLVREMCKEECEMCEGIVLAMTIIKDEFGD